MLRPVIAFTVLFCLASNCCAALPLWVPNYRDAIKLWYDPTDGNLMIDAAGKQISTFELTSDAGYLTGETPDIVLPPFDVHTPVKFFILKTDGIGDTDLGPILEPGLSGATLAADLTANGSILPRGGLGPVVLGLPEPASLSLASIGFLGLLGLRRR